MDDELDLYRPEFSSTTSSEEVKNSSGSLIWLILFIIAVLAIIGLVIWIIWLYNHRNCKNLNCCTGDDNCNCSNCNLLSLQNVSINVVSDTSVSASWAGSTGNTGGIGPTGTIFTLYATLNPPIINTSGQVTNTNTSAKTDSNNNTVTLTGLQPRLKYYISLVATNSNSILFFYTQIVYMQSSVIPTSVAGITGPNTFAIDDILQIGKLQVIASQGTNGTYPIEFNQNPVNADSLWYINNRGQIQSANTGLDTTTGLCLFNSNGKLVGSECVPTTTTEIIDANSNSLWTYNPPGFTNQWCLTNTVATAGTTQTGKPLCMVLSTINDKGIATVSVNDTATAGDAWAIAYQTNT